MNKKMVMVLFLIILFVLSGLSTKVMAYQKPEFKDGLADRWHPGALCISCHYSLSTTEKAQSISSGCRCHDKIYIPKDAKNVYEVDSPKILDLHKNIVCVRCHIGLKNRDVSVQDLHFIKNTLECTQCHIIENTTIKIPEKKKCFECHGGDPHVVHSNKTEKLCPACHGEFGERYLKDALLTREEDMLPAEFAKDRTVVVKEYPTIVDFIIDMIKSVINF